MLFTLLTISISSAQKSIAPIKIGEQTWSQENAAVTNYGNGEAIPFASNKEEWQTFKNNGEPAYCYYKFDKANEGLGLFYNHWAVSSPKELAPKGWRVATVEDWETLIINVGKEKSGQVLRTISGWQDDGTEYGSNNSVKFNGKPNGMVGGTGDCFGLNQYARFWAFDSSNKWSGYRFNLDYFDPECTKGNASKGEGLSVQFIKE
tara:strand:+ start:2382 stop:2996 length:615 start_codon:yes stop_codon:yes gene_type:complete